MQLNTALTYKELVDIISDLRTALEQKNYKYALLVLHNLQHNLMEYGIRKD